VSAKDSFHFELRHYKCILLMIPSRVKLFFLCRLKFSLLPNLSNFDMNNIMVRQDSVVGIATGYGLGDRGVGVGVPVGSRIFSTLSRPALGSTQPPVQWVQGALSLGVKQKEHEADHSPSASAEVKKMWIYTSTLPYSFMA
jgi:hypothetical protein